MEGGSISRTTPSMLSEITCGTAAELLMAVRYNNAPPGPTFLLSLDDVLRETRGGDVSTLRRGDMVEIVGASGSGKTSLALFLVLTRILPSTTPFDLPAPNFHAITLDLGGQTDHAVILVPTSHRSPIPRLANSLRDHIRHLVQETLSANLRPRRITPFISEQIEVIVRDSLSRLRVVRYKPRWKELYLALASLLRPPGLTLEPGKEMAERLDMVLIDGFGDPFWPERWTLEESGHRVAQGGGGSRMRGGDVGLKDVLAQLEMMRREMGAVVVLTLQGLWTTKDSSFYIPHLPPPYPQPFGRERDDTPRAWPLNVQITLTGRVKPHQFPADMTLVDALRALEVRQMEDDGSAVYEGLVRVPGGDGAAGTAGGKRFEMRIGEHGVEV